MKRVRSTRGLPKLHQGYKRKYVKCKVCKAIYWMDYIPYGIGNPILTKPCGHSNFGGHSNWDMLNATTVTRKEADAYYKKKAEAADKRERQLKKLHKEKTAIEKQIGKLEEAQ